MEKVAIKKEKIQDIIKLKEYIPLEHADYYKEIYKWPATDNAPDSDVDEEGGDRGMMKRKTEWLLE